MANAPVIFDDGGSTRIKQLKDNVNMDGLLGTPVGANIVCQDKADGPFVDVHGNFKCHMTIRFHQGDGTQNVLPPGSGGVAAGMDLVVSDTVVITSQNGQVATVTFDATNLLTVQLSTPVPGVIPLVEAKQYLRQRRYVVVNAGPIQTVVFIRALVTTGIFDLNANPSIYTMVHFS
jgi:hypothetical protein